MWINAEYLIERKKQETPLAGGIEQPESLVLKDIVPLVVMYYRRIIVIMVVIVRK